MEHNIRVEIVGLDSPHLPKVMALHASRKSRLGQFPAGAFEEHARKKLILSAVTAEGSLAGYLLYRVALSKNRASIVHLTRADEFRGKGVPQMLVERLKAETQHLAGISLSCRRDYNLTGLWSSLGFTVRHSKQGRGSDGALLDWWWFSQSQNDLFSYSANSDSRIPAAIDANIFYDLTDPNRPQGEDTKVLQADWLQESIDLCITPEIYNEIHRSGDESQKRRARTAAQAFRELRTDESVVRELEIKLKPWFNDAILDNDLSDLRQVAHAIAAEVPFLLTRDRPMLDRAADPVFETFGLRILHPTDLVNHLDVLRREAEYRPARLEGSRWRERLVTADDIDVIVDLFRHPKKERAKDFEKAVRHYLAFPGDWTSRIITDNSQVPVVFIVQRKKVGHLEVSFLRHSYHPLSGTLLRHLLHDTRRFGICGQVQTASIVDAKLSDTAKNALEELGYLSDGEFWWKLSLNGVFKRQEIAARVKETTLPNPIKEHFSKIENPHDSASDAHFSSRIEHAFSPVKIVSPETPCFVVSIRPDWAAHFFDVPGGQVLMDLNEKLHLGIEGVYYCAAKNTHVVAPGRILWYVSKGPRGNGSMSIKACSHLAETKLGTPKELFARFRHLGVYSWKNVIETAGGMDKKLMAFRFTRTERFVKEVTFSECQKLGIPQPVNPRRISDEQFAAIFQMGMKLIPA